MTWPSGLAPLLTAAARGMIAGSSSSSLNPATGTALTPLPCASNCWNSSAAVLDLSRLFLWRGLLLVPFSWSSSLSRVFSPSLLGLGISLPSFPPVLLSIALCGGRPPRGLLHYRSFLTLFSVALSSPQLPGQLACAIPADLVELTPSSVTSLRCSTRSARIP